MARLIDADELKKDFCLNFGGVSHAVAACEIIDRQPTIDPESLRPRAHWEDVFQDGPCRWSGECSACKVRSDIPPVILAHYCPYCGAKMEEALNGQ